MKPGSMLHPDEEPPRWRDLAFVVLLGLLAVGAIAAARHFGLRFEGARR